MLIETHGGEKEDVPVQEMSTSSNGLGKRKRFETVTSSDDESSESSDSHSDSDSRAKGSEEEGSIASEEESEDESEINETSDSSSHSESESESSESSPSSEESELEKKSIQRPLQHFVPPGQGTEATHLRNQRKARAKRLHQLVREGILPQGSKFEDLSKYEENQTIFEYIPMEYTPKLEAISSQSLPSAQTTKNKHLTAIDAEESQHPLENGEVRKGPPRRIDVAAVSRFIKAGLVGNQRHDRAREEARVKGKEKAVASTDESEIVASTFIPRNVAKKQKISHKEGNGSGGNTADDHPTDKTTVEDSLIVGFYEQVNRATKHRQSRAKKLSATVNAKTDDTNSGKLIIRAFECEPEWCGMAEVTDGQEIESIEIDPPSLPFVDNYTPRKKSKAIAMSTPLNTVGASPKNQDTELSAVDVAAFPKLETPFEGARIYFKSMFLHPTHFEPVFEWRWGKITAVEQGVVTIAIHGPTHTNEDELNGEMEEGEIENKEQTFEWTDFIDIRLY